MEITGLKSLCWFLLGLNLLKLFSFIARTQENNKTGGTRARVCAITLHDVAAVLCCCYPPRSRVTRWVDSGLVGFVFHHGSWRIDSLIRNGLEKLGGQATKFWTVLKTKQPSSNDAVENVEAQGFEYFHPRYRRRPVRGVRRVAPLFPHYLMVRVDESYQNWKVLCSTKGVSSVLMSGDRPGHVSDEAVEDIRSLLAEDGLYVDPLHEAPLFPTDCEVEGLRGLFAGKHGRYKGLAGNRGDRVRVLFRILGREAEFELGAQDIAAVLSLPA